jgi:hypothetical protein
MRNQPIYHRNQFLNMNSVKKGYISLKALQEDGIVEAMNIIKIDATPYSLKEHLS